MNDHLRGLGMSVGQFAILRALWEQDGLSLKEIAEVNFFLTASAKANRDAAIAGTVEVNERAFRGFDETEREAAMKLMERLEDNLREDGA